MSVTVAIDTSTPLTAAGIRLVDGQARESFDVPEAGARPRHATAALPLLEGLLAESDCVWTDISRVVVGVGPGGFTGIRVGIATALGIARGCGAEIIGVNGLGALLASCGDENPSAAFIDARRGELFAAASINAGDVSCISRESAGQGLPAGSICVGDGALLERERLTALGLSVPSADSQLHRVSPISLIHLAEAGATTSALTPAYVRAPDAVPTSEREQR